LDPFYIHEAKKRPRFTRSPWNVEVVFTSSLQVHGPHFILTTTTDTAKIPVFPVLYLTKAWSHP